MPLWNTSLHVWFIHHGVLCMEHVLPVKKNQCVKLIKCFLIQCVLFVRFQGLHLINNSYGPQGLQGRFLGGVCAEPDLKIMSAAWRDTQEYFNSNVLCIFGWFCGMRVITYKRKCHPWHETLDVCHVLEGEVIRWHYEQHSTKLPHCGLFVLAGAKQEPLREGVQTGSKNTYSQTVIT